MAMQVVLAGVNQSADNTWSANLTPIELSRLGTPMSLGPGRSVVLVTSGAQFFADSGRLELPAENVIVAYQGSDSKGPAVIVATNTLEVGGERKGDDMQLVAVSGDREFLTHVFRNIPELSETSQALLKAVREFSDGALNHEGRRYVERPDNFWTVEVQRRLRELKITVYGRAKDFEIPVGLDLKDDRPGYSTFKISREAQLEGAKAIIKQAWRRSQWKGG